MTNSKMTSAGRFLTVLMLTLPAIVSAQTAITWVSDPVRPDETVLVRGGGFGTQPVIEFARLDDGDPAAANSAALNWIKLPVLQASDDALKFIVPADVKPGVFECRVLADGATSEPVLLNRPDVWWMQGDAGANSTSGGWLRVSGKCLGTDAAKIRVQLIHGNDAPISLAVENSDGWSLRCALPATFSPNIYSVRVHNGLGGAAAWRDAGMMTVAAAAPWPTDVFSVLEPYGPDAAREMRKSLVKYGQPVDRSDGVSAALAKAKANGGGIVFFPAGRYHLKAPIELPPRTILKGEGMGLVTLWWGSGKFNIDGGGQEGLPKDANEKPFDKLINGPNFAIEEMSIYLPLNHRTGIDGFGEVRLRKVRIRVDHLWAQNGDKRPEGLAVRLGHNFEISDCDIIAKGEGLKLGDYGVVARNKILAGKSPCSLGSSRAVLVEDNQFVSTYPTAYQNIAGVGQDIYYARNKHEAQYVHQSDFSFTFDLGGAAFHGTLASIDGKKLVLSADPSFPKWADERSGLWRKAVVCIVSGRGSSQWRNVASFARREWTIAEPFTIAPDDHSVIAIVPMCGRALIVGNRFEDANWINAGFGTALDVIYAENKLVRCAELLNYGMASPEYVCPNFNVQCFDNELSEGLSSIIVGGSVRPADAFGGQVTQNIIHRRARLSADNSGGISIKGALREVVVEGCTAGNADSRIRVEKSAAGVLIRHCRSATGEMPCEGIVQTP